MKEKATKVLKAQGWALPSLVHVIYWCSSSVWGPPFQRAIINLTRIASNIKPIIIDFKTLILVLRVYSTGHSSS